MSELKLGKYEFYPNENFDEEVEKLLREEFPLELDETEEGGKERQIEEKFIEAARKYLAVKEAKRKKSKKNQKANRK
jgi:hypothetical protein